MSPTLVGTIRAVLLAAATAAIDGLIVAVSGASWGDLAPYAPLVIGGLRILEGLVDKFLGQPPQKTLGGGDATY